MNILLKIVTIFAISLLVKRSASHRMCANFFEYSVQDGQIYGMVTLAAPKAGEWTHLQISIGSNGEVRNNNKYIRLFKSRDETVLDALNGKNIKYLILFPEATENPTIKNITLNDKILCNENSGLFFTTWSFKHSLYFGNISVRTEHSSIIEEFYPSVFDWFYSQSNSNFIPIIEMPSPKPTPTPKGPTTRTMPTSGIWTTSLNLECGRGKKMPQSRMLIPRPLIQNGNPVAKEELPWLVYFEYGTWKKICGGTLISDRHIITAAHCVTPDPPIFIQLGKFDRTNLAEKGSKRVKPIETKYHPEFRTNKTHGDIGIVVFEPLVKFTPQIRPACLWPFGTDFDRDRQFMFGTVAGWGVFSDNHNNPSRIPMKTVVPIVDLDMCRKSDRLFADLATDHTICAGGQFSGPCTGDSGSGLYFNFNNIWYLRGVVSITATPEFTDYCRSDFYSVYVDIAFYLDWLKPHLEDVGTISPRLRNKTDTEIDNFVL